MRHVCMYLSQRVCLNVVYVLTPSPPSPSLPHSLTISLSFAVDYSVYNVGGLGATDVTVNDVWGDAVEIIHGGFPIVVEELAPGTRPFHRIYSITSIPSHLFHHIYSTATIPSHIFHHICSITSIPSHLFHHIYSITSIPLNTGFSAFNSYPILYHLTLSSLLFSSQALPTSIL